MPKAKKAKKNAPEAPVCLANERMENVIGKLFVSSFTRLHQIIQKDVVEMFEEEYRWAEELLEEVRREFASPVSKINLLPKTPSAKRKRKRVLKEPVIEEDEPSSLSSVPNSNVTDANILAYETPPQRVYRTRAASRTVQTKRTTRNQAKKVTKSEDSVLDEPSSTEGKKTPILNFNSQSKEVSVTYDNSEPNVFVKGVIPLEQSSASHVFSPPMGKPGKGHVKTKVHAYEEYIECKSPSSKQVVSQSPVPETPEQKDTITVSGETCQDTPEVVSHGKRSSVRQSLKTASTRKSLLKSSKIQMNPSLLHGTENETPGKKNKLKLKKKTTKNQEKEEMEQMTNSNSETDNTDSSTQDKSNELVSEKDLVVRETESVKATDIQSECNQLATGDHEVESDHHEQVQAIEPMEAEDDQESEKVKDEPTSDKQSDVSMHSTEEPVSRSSVHQELEETSQKEEMVETAVEEDQIMEEDKQVDQVKRDEEKKRYSKENNEDSEDEVVLISEDEDEPQSSEPSKQKSDSVTQADDESEEEEKKQPPRTSKRTKQRNPPKAQQKSESESDSEVIPPKRTRTKTRKVLENESTEAVKPVRTSTRTKQRNQAGTSVSSAPGSDTNSEADSGLGSANAGSTRTTRSKMRKPKESSLASDGAGSFAVPENPAPKARTTSRKRTLDTEGEEELNTSLTKKTKRESDSTSEETSDAAKSGNSTERKDNGTDDERSSQSEDDTPDQVRQQAKIVKPVSFLNNLSNKIVRPGGLNVSGVKSFLHVNTPPPKLSSKEQQVQRQRELEEKKKKEAERLQKREMEKKKKIEELRKKREERTRKVNERREQANREEMEFKNRMIKTMEEKSRQADDLKEEKMKEEQEKQRLRLKKLEEAEERRRQEEEERVRKLKEQEEMEQRNVEFMQRKKEYEEQERIRRKAEEKKKFDERMAEFERERIAEHERLKKIEEEKIRERQKLREERERQLAKERAERERQDMEKRKQKDLELKQKMEKIKELEKKRLMEEEKRKQELKERERAIQSIVNKHNMTTQSASSTSAVSGLPKPNLNSTLTVEQPVTSQEKMPNPDSYDMTPAKKYYPTKISLETYDISDLRSDDSTDEDEAPKKKVPTWALGALLKAALIQQHYHPPNLNLLFSEITPPDLNELFSKKKARFNKRTSSAIWTSPILKPGMN